MPTDANDPWYDSQGVAHPRPAPPANLAHLNSLLLEVQLNSTRLFVTSHRFVCLRFGLLSPLFLISENPLEGPVKEHSSKIGLGR